MACKIIYKGKALPEEEAKIEINNDVVDDLNEQAVGKSIINSALLTDEEINQQITDLNKFKTVIENNYFKLEDNISVSSLVINKHIKNAPASLGKVKIDSKWRTKEEAKKQVEENLKQRKLFSKLKRNFGITEEQLNLIENVSADKAISSAEDLINAIESKLLSLNSLVLNSKKSKSATLQQKEQAKTIEKLFNENPELANAVYEALGFKNEDSISKDLRFEYVDSTTTHDYFKVFYKEQDLTVDSKISDVTVGITLSIHNQGYIDAIEIPKGLRNKGLGKSIYRKVNSELLQGNLKSDSLGRISEDAKRVWESLVKSGEAVKTSDGYSFTQSQISPQQKQQAQQLYSQYLDTIFPDSKVKDIVYHGADEKIEDFTLDKKKNKEEKGLFFFGKRKSAQLWRDASFEEDNTKQGDLITAILALKNPRVENFENKSAWDMKNYLISNPSKLTKEGKSLLNTTFNKVDNNKAVIYANYLADGEKALKEILDTIARLHIYENYRSENRLNQLEKKENPKKELQLEIEEYLKQGLTIEEIYDKKIKEVKQKIQSLQETLKLLSSNKTSSAYLFASVLLNNNVEEEAEDLINYYNNLLNTFIDGGIELFEQLVEKNYSIYGDISEEIVDLLEKEKLSDFSKHYRNLLKTQIKEIQENFFIGELSKTGNPTDRNIFNTLTDNFIESFISEGQKSITVQFLKDLSNETSITSKTQNLVRELERRLDILKNKKNGHYLMTVLNLKQYNEKIKDFPSNLKENQDGLIATNVDEMYVGRDDQYVVFEPEQIHILGNKQDIEGFKKFVKESSKPNVTQITDEYGNTWNEVDLSNQKILDNSLPSFKRESEPLSPELLALFKEQLAINKETGEPLDFKYYSDTSDKESNRNIKVKDLDEEFFYGEDLNDGDQLKKFKYNNVLNSEATPISELVNKLKKSFAQQLAIFESGKKGEQQLEKISKLKQGLAILDSEWSIQDIINLLDSTRKDLKNSGKLVDELVSSELSIAEKLHKISYIKKYMLSFAPIRELSSQLFDMEGNKSLKYVLKDMLTSMSYVEGKYNTNAVPLLADYLYEVMGAGMNDELAKKGIPAITKESLIKDLKDPDRDLSRFNKYLVAAINSDDTITGLFSKAIKKVLEKARYMNFLLEQKLLPIFNKITNIQEIQKSFYTIEQYIKKDGTTLNRRKIVREFNPEKFYTDRAILFEERSQINEQLSEAFANRPVDSELIRSLKEERDVINSEISFHNKTYGILVTAEDSFTEMKKLREHDYDKFEYRLSKFYEISNENPDNMSDEDKSLLIYSGDVAYKYKGNRYVANEKLYPNENFQAIANNPEALELYNEFIKIYDQAESKRPYKYKLRGWLPDIPQDNFWENKKKYFASIGKSGQDKQYLKALDGEKYRMIPLHYTLALDESETSDNIIHAVLLYAADSNNYEALSTQLGAIEAIQEITEKYTPGDSTQKSGAKAGTNNRYEAIKKFIEQVVYQETKEDNGVVSKIADFINTMTSIIRIPLNPLGSLANAVVGNFANFSEAVGGRNVSLGDMGKANYKFGEMLIKEPNRLHNLLLSIDAIQGQFGKEFGNKFRTKTAKWTSTDNLFIGQNMGEYQIQGTMALAILENNGIELPEDGILDPSLLPEGLIDKIHEVSKSNQGVYSEFDRLYHQDNAFFRLFLQFRKYIVPSFRARYSGLIDGSYRMDFEAGTVERGYYRAFYDFTKDNLSNWKELPNIMENFNSLDPLEKEGVRRSLVDAISFMTIIVLISQLKGGDDEEPNWLESQAIYQLARLRGDIGAYLPGVGFYDQFRIINNPFAAAATIKDLIKLTYQCFFDFEEDDNGDILFMKEYNRDYGLNEAGDLKINNTLRKLNPLSNIMETLEPYQMYKNYESASGIR